MQKFIAILLFTFLILCYNSFAQGSIITVDVSQQPITISASGISTWEKDGTRIFSGQGNAKIEQGKVQIIGDFVSVWFTEVKVDQYIEGHMDVYCEGNVSLFQEGIVQNYKQLYVRLITNSGVVADSLAIPIQNFEEEQKIGTYLRGKQIRFERREEFASKEGTHVAVPTTSFSSMGEPIDIFADDLDTWVEKDVRIVVATGNVRVKKGSETLNAENIILYFDQDKEGDDEGSKLVYKEFYAEGNVTLIREKDVIIADKIFENFEEGKGVFVNSVIKTTLPEMGVQPGTGLPAYISGEEIRHRGTDQFEIKNGDFSTCGFGHPHFRFHSSSMRLFKTSDHKVITAKKNTLYAGNFPLFYLPYLSFDIGQKSSTLLKDWEIGKSTIFGRFIKTDWDIFSIAFGEKMDEWSDMTLSLDYLQARGPAAGMDFVYSKPSYSGMMSTYYIHDKKGTGINNIPVKYEDRGHFLLRHRHFLPKDWRADVEVSHVSDRTFFREYFYREFKMEKDRETLLYLRKIYNNRGITFLAEKQLRNYDTLIDSRRLNRTNETFPELKYWIIGEPIWDGRLNYTSETELAYHDKIFDWISPKRVEDRFLGRGAWLTAERVFDRVNARHEPEDTIRFDTNNTLNAPFHFLGVRFNPHIGIRFTGYSESVKEDAVTPGRVSRGSDITNPAIPDSNAVTSENQGDGAARGRFAIPIGLDTSTTLSRTYNVYNKLLNINRIRHIMTPEMRFNFIPVVTQNPEDLNQFDGIDALDTYQSIMIGLRNRFQTKQGETGEGVPIDFFDFDLEFNFFPGSAGLNRKRDDFVELDLRLRLSGKLSLLSEGNEINLGTGELDVVNLGLSYHDMPEWSLYLGSRYINNYSSTLILSTMWNLSEKWRVNFLEIYDFKARLREEAGLGVRDKGQNLLTRFVLSRLFHDWLFNITIDLNETRSDTITSFEIIPRGSNKTNKRFGFF